MRAVGRGFESLRFALAGNLLGRVLRIGLTFVSAIVLARLLGPEAFGLVAVIVATIRLATVPVLEGIAKLSEREIAGAIGRHDGATVLSALRFSAVASISVGLAAALIVGAFLSTYVTATAGNGLTPEIQAAVGYLLIVVLASALGGIVRGEGQTVRAMLPALGYQILATVGYVAWHFLVEPLSVVSVLWIQAGAQLAFVPIWAWFAWQHRPRDILKQVEQPAPRTRRWSSESAQFTILGLITVALMEVGVVLLGVMGSPEEAGLLRIANRVYLIATFVTMAAGQAVGPRIALLWQSGEKKALERPSRLISLLAICMAVPALVVVLLLGEELLALLFGDAFRAAYAPSLVLAAAAVVQSLGAISGRLLKMTGNQFTVTIGSIAGLAVAIGGNIVLIPHYGATGSALALFAGIVVSRAILNLGVYRIIGFNPLPGLDAVRDLMGLRLRR